MPNKSKTKGNSFERQVAAKLTEWWGSPFHRIPNSGALRWGDANFTYGDILPPSDCPVVIECKSYAKIDLSTCLYENYKNSLVYQWFFEQLRVDVDRAKADSNLILEPLLIFKSNNHKPILAMESIVAIKCHFLTATSHAFLNMGLEMDAKELVLAPLDAFLANCPKTNFLYALHQINN